MKRGGGREEKRQKRHYIKVDMDEQCVWYDEEKQQLQEEQQQHQEGFCTPRNRGQERYMKELHKTKNKIVVATGPAGTGKTLFCTEFAIRDFLNGKCDKLVFTRPSVSVDEDLGFLPGTLEEKMAPWIRPIYDILYKFVHPSEVTRMLQDKTIEISPLGYMRGRTFKNAWIIADEMQNSTPSQMKMLLTRIGSDSRVAVTGDLDQHDRGVQLNGLADFMEKFKEKRQQLLLLQPPRQPSSISIVEFDKDDIERDPIVKEVLDIYN